jgi:hypothetical protein
VAVADESTRIEALVLVYLALPSIIFLVGWIVFPLGLIAGLAMVAAIAGLMLPSRGRWLAGPGPLWLPIIAIAALWTVLAGLGHFVYANSDWTVRDAVLVDLVRDRWPVTYHVDNLDLVLRAPIGYFLPAALIGKLWGIKVAEQALLIWTTAGVALTFAMMLRDRPTLKAGLIRITIFIVFSGMDIVGTIAHYNPRAIGDHLEWWAFIFQYSSQTTQLFWVPNHALPGWLAIAWLVGQDPKRLSTTAAILFVLLAPLWSPLTAVGIAPIVGAALLHRCVSGGPGAWKAALLDWRMLLPLAICMALVFPYLIAGSDKVASGSNADLRWVGEDIVPRYIEFVLFEFAGFALLLIGRKPRDPLVWVAVALLLALPLYRFGPYNDLAMRASIPPLTLFAIELGVWLSTPLVFLRGRRAVIVAAALLAVGAVTPFMEVARVFIQPAWPMNEDASVVDVTRGTHYLTSPDQTWLRRFLKPPSS